MNLTLKLTQMRRTNTRTVEGLSTDSPPIDPDIYDDHTAYYPWSHAEGRPNETTEISLTKAVRTDEMETGEKRSIDSPPMDPNIYDDHTAYYPWSHAEGRPNETTGISLTESEQNLFTQTSNTSSPIAPDYGDLSREIPSQTSDDETTTPKVLYGNPTRFVSAFGPDEDQFPENTVMNIQTPQYEMNSEHEYTIYQSSPDINDWPTDSDDSEEEKFLLPTPPNTQNQDDFTFSDAMFAYLTENGEIVHNTFKFNK